MKNIIGLEVEKSAQVVEKLNELLADHQIYYQNLRGFHWLILGRDFFQLHEKFEGLYSEVADTIDEIAERVLMLGGIPLHTFEDYLKKANLEAVQNIRSSKESLSVVEQNILVLLKNTRALLTLSAENNDEGTVAMMGELISKYEKQLWMLDALTTNVE